MTYQQAEQFLLSIANFPRREFMKDRRSCETYMKRVQFFLDILSNPEKKIPHYIHVTGTSGKGSVSIMLESILRASGKKTGLNTSPHAKQITERWQINGKSISKKRFVLLVAEIKPALDTYLRTSPYDMISFFELMTAIAFYEFAKEKVEWAVMEVGLGGTYDPANLMPHKDIAVITNIGTDHSDLLGTKADIAREKAGIIQHGCAVFTAERDKKMLDIIKRTARKQKSLISDFRFQISDYVESIDGIFFRYKNEQYTLPVLGAHQAKNAGLAIDIARHLGISTRHIKQGLKKVRLPNRMEIISKNPLIILDGAHNADKMKTTVKTTNNILQSEFCNLHLVVAFSADKPWKKMVKQLASLNPTSIACTRQTSNSFRKVSSPQDIADEFKKYCKTEAVQSFFDPTEAILWSQKNRKVQNILLITGSMFLADLRTNI
jgi:dihydrofolate synthase / folylpolyglutamate synthase